MKACERILPERRSPEGLVPQVKARHGVQADVFVSAAGTFHAAVDGLPPEAAQAAHGARPLGDVVFEQVDPRVAVLPQVGAGHVAGARCLLVVVGDRVVHVGVGVGELFKGLAFWRTRQVGSEAAERRRSQPDWSPPPLNGFP